MSTYRSCRDPKHRIFAADNCCFSNSWEERKWRDWLEKTIPKIDNCLFATVPDTVGDHEETIKQWKQYSPTVRSLGYKPAFVAQNGCDYTTVPWDECDAVFLGGDDNFKLSPSAREIVAVGKQHGKWVHMGRVNSYKRCKLASEWGCDSVDGTHIAFAPDVETKVVVDWMRRLEMEQPLWL